MPRSAMLLQQARRFVVEHRYDYHRWLYRGGRLNAWGKVRYLKPLELLSRTGLIRRLVMLEVPGRTSGRTISYPLVLAEADGREYVCSMLGHASGWVRNVKANDMRVILQRRDRQPVQLVEITPDPQIAAPLLKRYLAVAPGARPHLPIDHRAPVADFEAIVGDYPMFWVESVPSDD